MREYAQTTVQVTNQPPKSLKNVATIVTLISVTMVATSEKGHLLALPWWYAKCGRQTLDEDKLVSKAW
jgi:hypothetical protein